MIKRILIVISLFTVATYAQDSLALAKINHKLDSLINVNTQLEAEVDSLDKTIEDLEIEIERMLWEQIKEGITMDDVIEIMGDPDEYQEADFGYKKLIYGEGYTGYVLIDKDLIVVDSTPPLYLRMEHELIKKSVE